MRRISSIFAIILIYFMISCELSDPGSPDDEPGVQDYSDATYISGYLTYGSNNYATNKEVWIVLQSELSGTMKKYERTVYTDGNGFYQTSFEPGTKYVDETWYITIYVKKPGQIIFSEVYGGTITIGSSKRVNINVT